VDKKVIIKADYSESDDYEYIEKIDLELKKGWNVVYANYVESINHESSIVTSIKPNETSH
jgi:glutamate formiminotransferase